MKYYLKALRNYANFSGRARRREYWDFLLFNATFGTLASMLDNLLGIAIHIIDGVTIGRASMLDNLLGIAMEDIELGPIYGLYLLATLIPGLAVTVRRLHDVGKSGSFLFILLIPLVGIIWVFVLFLTDSNSGENEYGENPKVVAV